MTRAAVLERIDLRAGTGEPQIRIEFNEPLRYASHRPEGPSATVEIQLLPVSVAGFDVGGGLDEEVLTSRPSSRVPLTEVVYQRITPQASKLILAFDRPVSYRVEGARDFRSLLITLQPVPEDRSEGRRASAPEPRGEPAFRGPVPRSDDVLVGGRAGGPVDFGHFGSWAVELAATTERRLEFEIPDLEVVRRHRLYSSELWTDGKVHLRLRLGFFASKSAAEQAVSEVRAYFPAARATRVPPIEQELSAHWSVPSSARQVEAQAPAPAAKGPPPAADERTALLQEAKNEMTAGNLRRAIQLLTKLLRRPEGEAAQEAKELLGLARERNKQLAHAKAEYEEYLERYPEGEASDRVRQRLSALLTARAEPRESLRQAGGQGDAQAEGPLEWFYTGSIGQFFRHDQSFRNLEEDGQEDLEEEIVNETALESDFDLSAGVRNERFEASVRVNGSNGADIQSLTVDDDLTLSTAVAELSDSQTAMSTRVGRQRLSTGGVLGRFDGGHFAYQALPDLQVNLVGGFPVESARDLSINDRQYFGGLSLDLGTFWDAWDFNLFFINQFAEGLTDRRAVGGEARYLGPNASAFVLLDYDIFFKHLNTGLLSANWSFENRSTINLALDYRSSPILTTSNALQGQGVDTLDQLRQAFSEAELAELAEDRTASSYSATLGGSMPLDETFQISGDVTVSNLSGTEESGGVEATEGTGFDFFYNLQLIGSGLLKDGDLGIVGLRFADTENSDRYTLDLNTRYPVLPGFRVNPRLRLEFRENAGDDGKEFSIRPSARFNYNLTNSLQFELELGGELRNQWFADGTEQELGYFVLFGYRSDF